MLDGERGRTEQSWGNELLVAFMLRRVSRTWGREASRVCQEKPKRSLATGRAVGPSVLCSIPTCKYSPEFRPQELREQD